MRCLSNIAAAAVCLAGAADAAAGTNAWSELRGAHFIVLHRAERGAAERVLARAEACYERLADDLGYQRRGDFWLWDRRVTIQLHESAAAYARRTGAPAWSRGRADRGRMRIDATAGEPDLLDSVLPHELAHLVLHAFLGPERDAPPWVQEGFAQRQESAGRDLASAIVCGLLRAGRLAAVRELASQRADAGTPPAAAAAFYAQSASLVGFLIDRYGGERFGRFCRGLRDGKDVDAALRAAYPDTVRDAAALDAAWREAVSASCASPGRAAARRNLLIPRPRSAILSAEHGGRRQPPCRDAPEPVLHSSN